MTKHPQYSEADVCRLWFACQRLQQTEAPPKLTQRRFTDVLESTGGLQVDSVNAVDRAHYLTLWSRFGNYSRTTLDKWVYDKRLAHEYWAHEASLVPASHLPLSRQRMKQFPPESWKNSAWWPRYATPPASQRRVLQMIREHGPLESADFTSSTSSTGESPWGAWGASLTRDDKRSLGLLWHAGRLGIAGRRHFRKIYDLAENVLPDSSVATKREFETSWLLKGLRGNGIASVAHLRNYMTTPILKAADSQRLIERSLREGVIREVRVSGHRGAFYALPEHLDIINDLTDPVGTTLVCPFDSLLWQRKRAEELLRFRYRVEIYVPEPKRQFGYYVMPILHNGVFVGRLDPRFDRASGTLHIQAIWLEDGFRKTQRFRQSLAETVENLARFLGADALQTPRGWD